MKKQINWPMKGRFKGMVLAGLASVICLSPLVGIPTATAGPIASGTAHVRLGFDATAPISEHKGDSVSLCPLVPPGLPAGVSYSIDVTGNANLRVDMGADVLFSYDKANVVAGGVLPVNITYTPTAGGGPNVHVKVPLTFKVEGCIKDCFLPDACDTITLPCTFEAGPTDFTAPLTGDSPVNVPVVSCTVSLAVAGLNVGSAHIEGSITLTPVPNTGAFTGLAGAGAAFGVSGPAGGPLIPVLEWDTAGQTVPANLTLNNPLPGAADVTLKLTPVFHWLATSADLKLVINLGSVLHDVGLSDPSPISLFSGSLGSIYTQVGLDTQVGDAVKAAVGFDPGFAAAIAAGNVPIPLTDPQIQVLNTSTTTPSLGSVSFKFSTDVTPPTTTASLSPLPTPFGWNNSDVMVTLHSSDPGGTGVANITYSASGAQTIGSTVVNAATTTFTITAPGITTVTFFGTDNAGNVESPKTIVVRIDETAPTIVINQPAAAQYPHSAVLTLDYSVTDTGGSGLDSFTTLLDGAPTLAGHGLASGQAIDLLTELALGLHTFSISAVDKAANTSATTVTFELIVTADSIKMDVAHFLANGQIKSSGEANSLLVKLNAAAAARAAGNCNTAANDYQAFINEVTGQIGKGIDPVAAAIMIADAQYLIAHCP